MPRIKLLDRSEMNAEQGRVYDAAKAAGGPLGGPYYAYIRLPKLFEAAQNIRSIVAAGPLSRREHQIVNRRSTRSTRARPRTSPTRASAPASWLPASCSPTGA
jgi:hypothetical protein